MLKFITKYWQVFAGVLAALAGVFFLRKRDNQELDAPVEAPVREEPIDFVEQQKEEVNASNKRIDDLSRDELIADINSKYS